MRFTVIGCGGLASSGLGVEVLIVAGKIIQVEVP